MLPVGEALGVFIEGEREEGSYACDEDYAFVEGTGHFVEKERAGRGLLSSRLV